MFRAVKGIICGSPETVKADVAEALEQGGLNYLAGEPLPTRGARYNSLPAALFCLTQTVGQ